MLKEYKDALIFLLKYLLVYVSLNSLYALYIDHYKPDADPITLGVTRQVTFLLSLTDSEITHEVVDTSVNVPILKGKRTVIEVYEGCNSINVIIVFVAFLIAFKGPLKATLKYLVIGVALIYVVNLLRVIALYWVALYIPDTLYFFHKFFFTGIIYLVVFAFWYFWINRVKEWKTAPVSKRE
jgi:exosortase family protein XrtF